MCCCFILENQFPVIAIILTFVLGEIALLRRFLIAKAYLPAFFAWWSLRPSIKPSYYAGEGAKGPLLLQNFYLLSPSRHPFCYCVQDLKNLGFLRCGIMALF